MTNKYDLSIIGGGPGGYVAAIKASQLGMKVALFEEDRLGGVCLNWGCIPTKSLLHSAEFIEEAKHFGLNNDDLSKIALEKIVEKSRKASENLSKGVSSLMKKNKIDVYAIKALPQLENNIFKIKSNDQFIESDRLILATGCKPRTIGDTKFSDLIWSSKEAMIPKFLPKNLSIIGSGAIGIEFASIYNALGSKVTVFESQDKILPQFDKDVSFEAQKIFETKVIEIAKKDGLLVDDTKIDSNSFNKLVKAIFEQGENVDQLFALKLALFEQPNIRDSKNDELKKKLRQCTNKIDTLKVAFEIIGS